MHGTRLPGTLVVACGLLLSLVACGGSTPTSPGPPSPGPNPPAPPVAGTPTTQSMLADLENYIASQLRELQEMLPRNQHIATYIQEKIALLQRTTLPAEVRSGGFYAEGTIASINGRSLPVSAVFPSEAMRAEAAQGVRELERVAPVLEGFLATPLPHDSVRMWYGFKIGNSAGGGVLYMEDKGTYESRPPSTKIMYDPIFAHELAHSYIGHESLTQFLEVLAYNMARAGSPDVRTWSYTRDHVPHRAANENVHALLDVYLLIGRDAMARAYRAVYPLRPSYGQPLSAECQQAFVNEAPEDAKESVAFKMSRVGY